MMDVYVADSSGNYNKIKILDLTHTKYRDFQRGEELSFVAPAKAPISPGAWVRVEDHGSTIYRGAAVFRAGRVGEPLEWACETISQVLKRRVPWGLMRYGAPPVVEGFSALTIADVLSSDAPSQAEGVARYLPGLIWLAHSYNPVTPTSRIDGVWLWGGWGSHPRIADRDVYVGGHLCSEVYDLATLTDSPYQIYRADGHLRVWGAGEADYGPVCIDNFKDTGLRLGNLDRSSDYLLAPLDVTGEDNYWQIIEDFLFDMGIYIRLRHVGNLTYLDGSINPWGRGSASAGAFTIRPGDYTDLERTAPKDIPPSALIVRGAGSGVSKVLYTKANLSYRGAWIEQTYDVSEGRLAPKGRLEAIGDAEWDTVSGADYLSLSTKKDHLQAGDWLTVEISPSDIVTAQISEISRDLSPVRQIKLGGTYASPKNAYLERQQSEAVAAMRAGQAFGDQEATDNLGPATTASISWTPTASDDRDTEEILVSLKATEPSDSNQSGLSVTYTLKINNTTYPIGSYPSGKTIAIIPYQRWGADPVFEVDITKWCAIDGTEETLYISVSDPTGTLTETLGYTITVRGIGRYGQSPKVTLVPDGVVSSTLDGNYYIESGFDGKWQVWPTGRARPFIKTGGTKYYGAMQTLTYGANPATFEAEWATNPATGAAWSQGDLDDLQAGVWLEVTAIPGGTASGEALFTLSDDAKPKFPFKLVLVSKNYVWVSYSISLGDKGISQMDTLRVELR